MSERIVPLIDDLNRPFWDGCRERTLRVQECSTCKRLRYPIAPVCPSCMGTDWAWRDLTGDGKVYTFAVFRHAYNEAWPYTVAIVALDEGVMMIGDLTDIPPADVTVGLRVRVDFEPITERITIPRFAPIRG
jgi:uncharacterized OB-fold protein